MTSKKVSVTGKGVKLLDDALAKYGSIPEIQRELTRIGADISITALYKAQSGRQRTFKPDVIVALVHLLYSGDWKKGGRVLEADYLPEGLRR